MFILLIVKRLRTVILNLVRLLCGKFEISSELSGVIKIKGLLWLYGLEG